MKQPSVDASASAAYTEVTTSQVNLVTTAKSEAPLSKEELTATVNVSNLNHSFDETSSTSSDNSTPVPTPSLTPSLTTAQTPFSSLAPTEALASPSTASPTAASAIKTILSSLELTTTIEPISVPQSNVSTFPEPVVESTTEHIHTMQQEVTPQMISVPKTKKVLAPINASESDFDGSHVALTQVII